MEVRISELYSFFLQVNRSGFNRIPEGYLRILKWGYTFIFITRVSIVESLTKKNSFFTLWKLKKTPHLAFVFIAPPPSFCIIFKRFYFFSVHLFFYRLFMFNLPFQLKWRLLSHNFEQIIYIQQVLRVVLLHFLLCYLHFLL